MPFAVTFATTLSRGLGIRTPRITHVKCFSTSQTAMTCPGRIYPLRQPPGHKPPVPRWTLKFPDNVDAVYTSYIGAQWHGSPDQEMAGMQGARTALEQWRSSLDSDTQPLWTEHFTMEHGQDVAGSAVEVHYWTSHSAYTSATSALRLADLHAAIPASTRTHTGLWSERFGTPITRLETNYAGPDYLPGLGQMPGTWTAEHDLSAYWGAARDRIPASGRDQFAAVDEETAARKPPALAPKGLGQHIRGVNGYDNLVHIRSGQFWELCGDEERLSYEGKLEPTLLEGLGYLWDNPVANGVIGLRFLRNTKPDDEDGFKRKETCGAGFFRNLADLERWAEKHISHQRIWAGAIGHAKRFGEGKKFRTWHEVSVLKAGEAQFDYVNCRPETGALQWLQLDDVTAIG